MISVWSNWSLYPPHTILGFKSSFTGEDAAAALDGEELDMSAFEDAPAAPAAGPAAGPPTVEDLDGEDLDGEPFDAANTVGLPGMAGYMDAD